MIEYKIEFKSETLKFLKKLPTKTQTRLINAIKKLPNGDIKRLLGIKNQVLYRLRVRQLQNHFFYR